MHSQITRGHGVVRGVGTGQGPAFGEAIVKIVYGYNLWQRVCGVMAIIKVSLQTLPANAPEATQAHKTKQVSNRQKKRAAASPSPA
jgi:hypothetical protein